MNKTKTLIFTALPVAVAVVMFLIVLSLLGCTIEQTDRVRDTAITVRDVAGGPVGDTIGVVVPPAAPFIRLTEAIAGAVVLLTAAWGAFQSRRAGRAETLASETFSSAAGIVTTLDPVLTEAQKAAVSARMPTPSKQLVREVKGEA